MQPKHHMAFQDHDAYIVCLALADSHLIAKSLPISYFQSAFQVIRNFEACLSNCSPVHTTLCYACSAGISVTRTSDTLSKTRCSNQGIQMEVIASTDVRIWFSCFIAGIFWLGASYVVVIALYNLICHPLAQYPGPLWARVSPLYAVFHAYRRDVHVNIEKCHDKYGRSSETTLDRTLFPK